MVLQEDKTDGISNTVLFQAMKRSRMGVLTFSAPSNIHRGFKALSEYVKGKSIKVLAILN